MRIYVSWKGLGTLSRGEGTQAVPNSHFGAPKGILPREAWVAPPFYKFISSLVKGKLIKHFRVYDQPEFICHEVKVLEKAGHII